MLVFYKVPVDVFSEEIKVHKAVLQLVSENCDIWKRLAENWAFI